MDDSGVSAEIGYVYTFIISSMLLTSMTLLTTDMVNDSSRASLRMMLRDMANHIEEHIGEVASHGAMVPNSTFERLVTLQPAGFEFSYSVSATDHLLYVNSTYQGVRVLKPLSNPGDLDIRGTVSSSARAMSIVYSQINGTGAVRIMTD
ncbi:MAG: hypothetical protein L0Z54_05800 [Thermoplasmata archaeon]|nr:hypothetical protein [Thermoplasmata archaeon]